MEGGVVERKEITYLWVNRVEETVEEWKGLKWSGKSKKDTLE